MTGKPPRPAVTKDPMRSGALPAYSSALAFELVSGLDTIESILARHGLTAQQLERLTQNLQFKNLLLQVKREWEHPMNAEARSRAKALMAVEDTMIQIVDILNDPDSSPQVKIDAFKNLTALGAPRPSGGPLQTSGTAGGVNVVINLAGGDKQSMTFDQFEDIPEELIADNEDK